MENNERQVLINLIAGLSLADHMGDVLYDCQEALRMIGIPINGDDGFSEIAQILSRDYGATSLRGTILLDGEDEGEND